MVGQLHKNKRKVEQLSKNALNYESHEVCCCHHQVLGRAKQRTRIHGHFNNLEISRMWTVLQTLSNLYSRSIFSSNILRRVLLEESMTKGGV
jgi:hypothetical protein